MTPTPYTSFFQSHPPPTGWNPACDDLLHHFFRTYESPKELRNEIILKLKALLEDKPDPELPDDWNYFWGKLLPRKDYVYFIDAEEVDKVNAKHENSWEGSALLDENKVEQQCTKYLKIPTKELLALCLQWEAFLKTA